ncbi:MAG: hypothetical protein QOG76_3628 [Pseudonocardiales bacterium]|nr:hypothetical protein [Pseudonocardiales bacterium]
MKCGARVAIGVAGGYFLGRTKKMKLALMLGGMAAGRQAGGPGQLLGQGAKLLGSSPELAALRDQLTGRLVDAGKDAVMAVAARQLGSLTDRVSDRVESLTDPERLNAVRPRRKGRRAAAEDADDTEPGEADDEAEDEDEAVADTEDSANEASDGEVDDAPDDGADADEETERAPAKSGARSRSASANSSRNRTSTRSSSSSGRTSTTSKAGSTGNATPKRRAAGAAATRTVGAARSGAKSATSRASRGSRSER